MNNHIILIFSILSVFIILGAFIIIEILIEKYKKRKSTKLNIKISTADKEFKKAINKNIKKIKKFKKAMKKLNNTTTSLETVVRNFKETFDMFKNKGDKTNDNKNKCK